MSEAETLKAQREALLNALDRLLAVLPKPGDRAYLSHYARIEADEARAVVADVRNTEAQRATVGGPTGAQSSAHSWRKRC